jgi:NodT family efflux transporter outer membrane factor (OMF) lipoprotein
MQPATPSLTFRALVALTLAGVLAGCKAGPDYAVPPAPASAALSKGAFLRGGAEAGSGAMSPAAPLARWWEGLGDPVLNGLVEAGLRDAPAIAAAEARVRQARAGLSAAHAAQMPGLSSNALWVHTHLPSQSLGGALGGSDLTALGFDAQWELDLWGGQRRTVEKARAGAEAQAARLADAQVTLSAEIVRAYVSLRAREAAVALQGEQRDLDAQAAVLMRQRFAAGTVGRQALEAAEAQADRSEAELAATRAEAAIWRDTLAMLTGQAPGALDTLAAAPVPLPPAEVAIGDPGAMLARRPDIRAAERAYAAATAGVGVEQARRYPGISLMGLVGVGGSSVSNLADSGQLATLLTPRLSWDFPDFGRVEANVRSARAARDVALAEYHAAVLAGLQDAEGALARFGAARVAEARAEAGAKHGEAINTLEQQRATAGVIGTGDAIAARRQAIGAKLAEIDAREGLTLAYATLAKALGLGWQAER